MIQPPPITWKGAAPGNFAKGRGGVHPEAIVAHISEGTLTGGAAWFNNPASGVSAHFQVGKAGEVWQHVKLADTSHANGVIEEGHTSKLVRDNSGINPNRWSVAIEHEGTSGMTLTPVQWATSTWLTAWLFESALFPGGATGVAVDRDHILMHRDITPQTRARCPGWGEEQQAAYIAEVRRLLDPHTQKLRAAIDAITLQAAAEDERALRLEKEAAGCRVQAANLRKIVDGFR